MRTVTVFVRASGATRSPAIRALFGRAKGEDASEKTTRLENPSAASALLSWSSGK
jgi:ribosomal protein S11